MTLPTKYTPKSVREAYEAAHPETSGGGSQIPGPSTRPSSSGSSPATS